MKINQKQKELIRVYLFLFVLMFAVINWDSVSWVFNYRAISGLTHDFLYPYPDSEVFASDNGRQTTGVYANAVEPQKALYPYSEKANSIEIPSIGITAPVIIGASTQIPALEKDLDKGVVYYPGSVLPGENGQIIVLGHSAPPLWPHIKYDWVFTDIEKLEKGQTITLYFNHTEYTYKVISKAIINKGQDVTPAQLNGKNNILTLVSCWPPGSDYKRITVQAELIR